MYLLHKKWLWVAGLFSLMSMHLFSQTDTATNGSIIQDTVFIAGDTIHNIDTVIHYVYSPKKAYHYIGIEMGLTHPFNHYSGGESQSESLMNNELDPVLPQTFSLQLYRETGHFMYSTGIGISKYKSKIGHQPFNFIPQQTFFSYTDTLDTWYQVVGNDTMTFYETNTVSGYQHDSLPIKEPYNNNLYLSFPIQITANYWFENMDVFLSAGIIFNLCIQNKDQLFVNESSNLAYSRNCCAKLLYQGILGTGIHYYVSNDMIVTLGAMYKMNLNSRYTSDFPYHFRQSELGVLIGLKYFIFQSKDVRLQMKTR